MNFSRGLRVRRTKHGVETSYYWSNRTGTVTNVDSEFVDVVWDGDTYSIEYDIKTQAPVCLEILPGQDHLLPKTTNTKSYLELFLD